MQHFITKVLVCSCGHVFGTRPDTKAHEHFKDKQYLGPGECLECNEEHRMQLEQGARMCDCFDDGCADGCAYVKDLNTITDPPPGLVFLREDDDVEIIDNAA